MSFTSFISSQGDGIVSVLLFPPFFMNLCCFSRIERQHLSYVIMKTSCQVSSNATLLIISQCPFYAVVVCLVAVSITTLYLKKQTITKPLRITSMICRKPSLHTTGDQVPAALSFPPFNVQTFARPEQDQGIEQVFALSTQTQTLWIFCNCTPSWADSRFSEFSPCDTQKQRIN